MKLNKHGKALADDLNLNEAEAAVMELKAKLYQRPAKSIAKSKLTHEAIAKKVGTSRARQKATNIRQRQVSNSALDFI